MLEVWKLGRMHVRPNGQLLKEVHCFKYLGFQVAVDGGYENDVVHRMNEGIERGEHRKVC